MPYSLALLDEDNDDAVFGVDTSVDFLFIFDIIVNFCTPLLADEKQYDYNRSRVAMAYFKSWFMVDILASVPINLILRYTIDNSTNVNLSGSKMIRIARLPRLYRLLRMARLFKVLKFFKRTAFFQKI